MGKLGVSNYLVVLVLLALNSKVEFAKISSLTRMFSNLTRHILERMFLHKGFPKKEPSVIKVKEEELIIFSRPKTQTRDDINPTPVNPSHIRANS